VDEGGRGLQLLSHVCLQTLTKTIEILSADSRRLCRDPNREPPERKSKALSIEPTCPASICFTPGHRPTCHGVGHTYPPSLILQFGLVLTPSAGVATVSSTSAQLRSCVEVSLSLSGRGCRIEAAGTTKLCIGNTTACNCGA